MPKGISNTTGVGVWKGRSRGKQSAELIEKRVSTLRGRKRVLTPEWRRNIGLASKGRISWYKGKKGLYKTSEETKKKISVALKGKTSGSKHYKWKGGITSEASKIRQSYEYSLWRKAVFERDKWTCVWCSKGGSGVKINADHIKPFALYPELRFAIDNGRTLCVPCHKTTDTYGGKKYAQETKA